MCVVVAQSVLNVGYHVVKHAPIGHVSRERYISSRNVVQQAYKTWGRGVWRVEEKRPGKDQ
jgi:hypothetical protein